MSGSSLASAVVKINQLAANYERTPRDVVAASARVYKSSVQSSIASVTVGNKLRGVGKNGARVGVKSTVTGEGYARATAIVQATGPLHLLERDNADHIVPRVAGSRRRRTASGRLSHKRQGTGETFSGRRPMLVNGQWRTGPWKVRGSKGKYPFARGIASGSLEVQRVDHAQVQSAITRAIRG